MSIKSTYKEKLYLLTCLNNRYKEIQPGEQKDKLESQMNTLVNELTELRQRYDNGER